MKRRSFFGALAGLALGFLGAKAAEPKGMMVGLTSGRLPAAEKSRRMVVIDEFGVCDQDMVRLLEAHRVWTMEDMDRQMDTDLWGPRQAPGRGPSLMGTKHFIG